MKVYVDDNNITNLDDLFQATNSYECWAGNCGDDLEIVSLSDHDNQVRKKVVEDIKERLKKANLEIMSPIDLYSYTDNFLYQVEKEIKRE